ncbi:MAG: response regulator [Pseudobdellovibrionaceae bacterium]
MIFDKKTILVVEDHADSRLLMAKVLRSEGFEVVLAEDGIQALNLLSENRKFDLILMDLSMPQMNGEEFLAAVRKLPHHANIKVLVVSGWDNLKSKASRLGASGFIRKPIDINELLEEVARNLSAAP